MMPLTVAVRRAIRRAPGSMRALARTAGVSHAMLAAIVAGKEKVTLRVARLVAQALEEWSVQCAGDAAAIRAALDESELRRRSL